jgi:hypothetical protein
MLKLPRIIILLLKSSPIEGAGEPTVDHFALVVRDLAATTFPGVEMRFTARILKEC